METLNGEKIMSEADQLRKQIICEFAGVCIDMDYILCIPSVHAKYQFEEIVVDFSGGIREMSNHFPMDKARLIVKWVNLHKEEIMENHRRVNNTHEIPLKIEPLSLRK